MFCNNNNRSFFCDLATAVKKCCLDHEIDIDTMTEEFDEFLDELDIDVNNFINRIEQTIEQGLKDIIDNQDEGDE